MPLGFHNFNVLISMLCRKFDWLARKTAPASRCLLPSATTYIMATRCNGSTTMPDSCSPSEKSTNNKERHIGINKESAPVPRNQSSTPRSKHSAHSGYFDANSTEVSPADPHLVQAMQKHQQMMDEKKQKRAQIICESNIDVIRIDNMELIATISTADLIDSKVPELKDVTGHTIEAFLKNQLYVNNMTNHQHKSSLNDLNWEQIFIHQKNQHKTWKLVDRFCQFEDLFNLAVIEQYMSRSKVVVSVGVFHRDTHPSSTWDGVKTYKDKDLPGVVSSAMIRKQSSSSVHNKSPTFADGKCQNKLSPGFQALQRQCHNFQRRDFDTTDENSEQAGTHHNTSVDYADRQLPVMSRMNHGDLSGRALSCHPRSIEGNLRNDPDLTHHQSLKRRDSPHFLEEPLSKKLRGSQAEIFCPELSDHQTSTSYSPSQMKMHDCSDGCVKGHSDVLRPYERSHIDEHASFGGHIAQERLAPMCSNSRMQYADNLGADRRRGSPTPPTYNLPGNAFQAPQLDPKTPKADSLRLPRPHSVPQFQQSGPSHVEAIAPIKTYVAYESNAGAENMTRSNIVCSSHHQPRPEPQRQLQSEHHHVRQQTSNNLQSLLSPHYERDGHSYHTPRGQHGETYDCNDQAKSSTRLGLTASLDSAVQHERNARGKEFVRLPPLREVLATPSSPSTVNNYHVPRNVLNQQTEQCAAACGVQPYSNMDNIQAMSSRMLSTGQNEPDQYLAPPHDDIARMKVHLPRSVQADTFTATPGKLISPFNFARSSDKLLQSDILATYGKKI